MSGEEKQLRNTKQRKHMLSLLSSTKSHPNAFWLFEKMKQDFPNLSLSTVYRNLGVLESQGLVQRLACGNEFDRYDANTDMHSHFFCRKCEKLYDIETNNIEEFVLDSAKNSEHQLEGCSVTFHGICNKCKNQNKKIRRKEK